MWEDDPAEVAAVCRAAGATVRRAFRMPDGEPGFEVGVPDVATKVRLLNGLARRDAREPGIRRYAELVAATCPFAGPTLTEGQKLALCVALQEFVQAAVRFVFERVETFSSPEHVLKVGVGDCDDSARLLAALILSLGLTAEVALLQAPKGAHVAARAAVAGRWIWLETTVAARPGEHPRDAARRLKAARPDMR